MSNPPVSMESLLQAHHPFLVRLAVSLVGDSPSADDLVQEATRRALVAAPDAAAIERPRPWLARILRNEAAREAAREGSRPKAAASLGDSAPQVARGLVDPEALALRAEREQVVGEELFRLSQSDRDVLFLRFYDDLSIDDIALSLGLSRTATQSRLTRAKARLAERLELRLGTVDSEKGGWHRALLPIITGAAGERGRRAASSASSSVGASVWLRSWWPWIAAAAASVTAFFLGTWLQADSSRAQQTALVPTALVGLGAGAPAPVAPPGPGDAAAAALHASLLPQPAAAQEEARSVDAVARDEASNGLLGVPVVLAPFDPTSRAIGQELRGATDRSGRFQRGGLEAAPYLFRFRLREFLPHDLRDVDELSPVISRSMTVPSAAYPVRIGLAPDMALAPGTVCTLWTMAADLPIACETFEASAGLMGHVLAGTEFRVTAPGFAPSATLRVEPSIRRDDEGVRELIFRLESCEGAALSGQVLGREPGSGESQPLASADVILTQIDGSGSGQDVRHALTTDGDGRFVSPFALPYGTFRVEIYGKGHGLHRATLQHAENGEPTPFQLEAHRVLRGRVLHGGGPVEFAKVQASLSGETYPTYLVELDGPLGPRPRAWSGPDGKFEIHGLPAERVSLFAEGPRSEGLDSATHGLEVPASGALANNITMSIVSATLAQGRVLGADGDPVEGIRVQARQSSSSITAGSAFTNESGVFTIQADPGEEPVHPGDALRLTAIFETTVPPSYDMFANELGSIEVSAGALDADFLSVQLPSVTAAAKGRVVISPSLADSLRLEELEIHFQSTSMYTEIFYRSLDLETGVFDFAPIPTGTYDLSICRAEDYGVIWARSGIELGPEAELDFGDLVVGDLAGAGHLEILVQDQAGERLDKAALGSSALCLSMSSRMLFVFPKDEGDRWRPEFALNAGDWFVELRSTSYRAPKAEFVIREGETTQLVVTATRR